MCPPPLIGLRNLLRVSGRRQHFGDQRVRVERDRRYQLLQLLTTQRLYLRLRLSIALLGGLVSIGRLLLRITLLLLVVRLLLRVSLLLLIVGLLLRIRLLLLIVGLLLLRIRLLLGIRLLPIRRLLVLPRIGILLCEEFYLADRQQKQSHGERQTPPEYLRYAPTNRAGRGARRVQGA